MKRSIPAALCVLFLVLGVCHLNAQVGARVQIPGTQMLSVTSSILGEDFSLFVQLPRFYEDTTRVFPVVYLLDGQWDFPLVNGITGGQYYDGFIPELIVVGIGWAGEHVNYDSLRQKDLSPTRIPAVAHSGNGPKFLSFLKNEVIPLIESKYRTAKNERTLIGSSFGGLFSLYTLFAETSLFNRYIVTSPALDWDNNYIAAAESTYAASHDRLPVRLFMSIGGCEPVVGFQKCVERLKGRGYKDFTIVTRVCDGMGHSGSKPEGFARGLQAVFARPSITLDSRTLDQYSGTYEPMPGMRIKLVGENGRLVVQLPGGEKIALDAETDKDFYMKGMYLFLHFKKDAAGNVAGFQMEQFVGGGFVKKGKD
jgi:predicted alpha/beta superfamily hydrolase